MLSGVPFEERNGMPVVISFAVFLLVVVAITLPAGYGLPAPVFALIAVRSWLAGLLIGWVVYRAMVKRGPIPPVGKGPPEFRDRAGSGEAERPAPRAPNREQAAARGPFFPRAG